MELAEALGATRGLTCVVGAGGKKSTLYALAPALSRAVVTATVRIPIFDRQVATVTVTDDPASAVRRTEAWPIGVVPSRNGDRYEGYAPAVVDELAAAGVADAILVKADGARTRWLKAPGENEPRLPDRTDVVVPIASAKVVGEPLDATHVHRPERVAAITGLRLGEAIGSEDVAAVLASEAGGRKGVPAEATVVPVINMVDDADLEATARAIAAGVLERSSVSRVVLTKLIAEEPLVAVIDA